MSLLKANNLTIKFGGLTAVSDFSLTIGENDLVGLIGPNGAGKTTIFNMLTGVYAPTSGNIQFNGESIEGIKPYEITKKNIARTFQNIRLLKSSSVIDNVKISFNYQIKYNIFDAVFRTPRFFKGEKEIEEKALELLKIFKLDGKKDELASNLPYGDQRRLEIVRALAASPKLLLLDEPAAGMNPQETTELMHLINWIRDEFKIAILLIEHDMKLVMGVCEKIVVVDYGKVIAEGTPDEIKKNEKVIKAYLGEGGADAKN
ncbi:MAG: ABC transporter ATP-binding protein [Bacillota bacterium]|nr:ABC transporter ATP-binding protein [Bacillota bacterium]